jgi:hypothetical protein
MLDRSALSSLWRYLGAQSQTTSWVVAGFLALLFLALLWTGAHTG